MNRKVLIFCAALGLMVTALMLILYPLLSSFLSDRHRSEVHSEYCRWMDEMDSTALKEAEKEAIEYNRLLSGGICENSSETVNTDYYSLLNTGLDGIMAYVEIPAIDVYLPVAHGTGAETLQKYVGHLIGSSLPTGGNGTHAVLSGHSGLAGQVMFSDLGQLKKGDMVYIHVLGKTLAYKVTGSDTALPSDVSQLAIEPDRDLLTLVTCTPLAVNTHRLLVHCERTEDEQDICDAGIKKPEEAEPQSSDWVTLYLQGLAAGGGVLAAAGCIYAGAKIHRKGRCRH